MKIKTRKSYVKFVLNTIYQTVSSRIGSIRDKKLNWEQRRENTNALRILVEMKLKSLKFKRAVRKKCFSRNSLTL